MTLEEKLSSNTADPEAALAGLKALLEIRPTLADAPDLLNPLASLFSGSDALTSWLLSRPSEIDWLADKQKLLAPRPREAMEEAMRITLAESSSPMKALRLFKHRELARIAARDLSGLAPVDETLAEWSAAADIAIDAAVKEAERRAYEKYGTPHYIPFEETEQKIAKFAVLAMGKLGGAELNISSDIDIIYIHSSDNGNTTGAQDGSGVISLHQFFVYLAREATRLLSEVTEDGYVFRVDLDLRPEGKKGEISNSIGAMEVYYESWGQQWERQALIKARHCGGSEEVSAETLSRLKPFMFRKYLDQRAIDEIASMKSRIDQSLTAKKGVKGAERNLKLGQGGIREIEFIVQSIQLLYGARYPELQIRSTLKALTVCHSLALLSAPHYRDLRESYLYLRRLENRVQYHQLLQTHSLPESPQRLTVLGRLMGFDSADPAAELMEETARRRKRVRGIFDLFFAADKGEKAASFPVALDDEEAMAAWLDSINFDQPEESAKSLNTLRNGKAFAHPSERSRAAFDSFGPAIVNEALATPWPDHVIFGFDRFVEAKGARDMLYELLDENRAVIKLLAAIFSSSEHLTSILIRQPDILDRLLVADPVSQPADRFRYAAEFASTAEIPGGAEKKMASLNVLRSAESLRLGLKRLLNLSDRFEVMNGLSMLAEEYLKTAVSVAMKQCGFPETGKTKWAIIAAGKLGRMEMNYGSDIDLLAFCDGDEAAKESFVEVVKTLIKLSSMPTPYGQGYAIDMRLRPYGEKGELAPLFSSMSAYYGGKAGTWERIAMVGARPMAGNPEFVAKVMATLHEFIAKPQISREEAAKIASIRERIADEKVKTGAVDIKFGRGGLIEIEFICQWLLIENPPKAWNEWETGPFTVTTLEKAKKEKWLTADKVRELRKAYDVYRAIEDSLRMDRERSVNAIPSTPEKLKRLARMASFPGVGPEGLLSLVKETMSKVREIYLDFVSQRAR